MDEDEQADAFFEELLGAVDQQLESDSTPYVRKQYDRLTKAGLSDDEAREAIARCLAEETDRMYRSKKPFDEKAYRTSLEMINPGD
ncbi:conserved hypothetical protein [Haloferula helveola]|uniref:Uncharacterized protein n=2 Tax=Haloferula helveola TaxID=490095 RepID=A0ABN6HAL1_9BACT|nr:conserved hypothetical protein [Haloferula helveola]